METGALNIFKSAIEIVPTYDGNPNQLYRFVETAETILSQFFLASSTDSFQSLLVIIVF